MFHKLDNLLANALAHLMGEVTVNNGVQHIRCRLYW